MWTARADQRRGRTGRRPLPTQRLLRSLALLTAAPGLLSLAACSDDLPPPTYSGGGYAQVADLLQRAVNLRAAALRNGDEVRFRGTLDRSDAALVEEQQTYFDNLAQLPIQALRYRVLADTISPVEGSEDYWAEVVVVLRLDGYDAAPVRTRDRFLFTPTEAGDRMLVASTTDWTWESDHPGNAQPWDLGRIHVEERYGVLGIFDDHTREHATDVVNAVSDGRADVRTVITDGDSDATAPDGVVVYAVQDPTFLRGLAGQTVGDRDRADGLTIAIPANGTDSSAGVASYRVFLSPRVLDEPAMVVGRLVRHELTHAALGSRGRSAPLWLNEGLAEYVSVQPMPPDRRRLPQSALSLADRVTDLPGQAEFAGPDAEAWYAVSWWVCEYIARSYGEEVLLHLLDELDAGADQGEVLEKVLGLTSAQLSQRGVALMGATYDH